jgi:predicted permease
MEILIRIASILFPIFAIVGAGYLYARRHAPEMTVANRLNMDIFVPALVFAALSDRAFEPRTYLPLALCAVLLVALCGLLARVLAQVLRLEWKTVVPPMMFNNSANIGLPLAVLAWGQEALPAAVMLFIVSNLLHFSVGVRLLDPRAGMLGVLRVPSVAAMAAGFSVNLLGIPLWPPILEACRMVGDIAIPLLLFALGVRMTSVRFTDLRLAVLIALLRPAVGALLAWAIARLVGLGERESAMFLVFGALPPAVMNFLFAERYAQEPARVASIVLVGNLAAVITLPLALALAL